MSDAKILQLTHPTPSTEEQPEEIKDVKHTITVKVTPKTWDIFKMICDTNSRCPGNQIAWFLQLMSGESKPSVLSHCPEIETKLYLAFSSLQNMQKIEANKKRGKIIPFPIMLEGCN